MLTVLLVMWSVISIPESNRFDEESILYLCKLLTNTSAMPVDGTVMTAFDGFLDASYNNVWYSVLPGLCMSAMKCS